MTHVTDAVGLRSFTYYETGAAGVNQSARLKSETLPAAYGSHVINHEYQFGVANRAHGAPTALKLGTGTNYDVSYAYDSKLRLNTVGYQNLTDFTYTYEANSNLIDKVSQGASAYRRDYTYETTSDRMSKSVTTWSNTASRTIESRFGHNLAGLRNNEKLQGSDYMSTLGRASEAGVNIDYDYNDRLELDYSGKDVLASNWTVGSPHGATNRSYTYDLFGNRTADVVGSTAGAYTPNSLNEYTAAPGMGTITYDDSGNLLSDGTKTFTYDRENRVRTMTTGGSTWTYVYDYLGRRVEKKLGSASQKKFVYDGWNLIAELNGSGTLTRTFAWGLDASGSLQGAGGVGGLLVIDEQNGTKHLPTYDGSHNVIALYNASSGAITAAYEYDPFGRVATAAGGYAASNPFRFSTKYEDSESGLNYYGHRYYSAQLGRFINRDPIEEGGGLNLYAFTHNDGVNKWDYLGMSDLGGWISRFLGGLFSGSFSADSGESQADQAAQEEERRRRAAAIARQDARERATINKYGINGLVFHGGSGDAEIAHAGAQAYLSSYFAPDNAGQYGPYADGYRFPDSALNPGAGGLLAIGNELFLTGVLRGEYLERASRLSPDDVAGRIALQAEFRARQTELGKAITREILKNRNGKSGRSNATKTNPRLNAAGNAMRVVGRGAQIIAVGVEVSNVVNAPEGERAREAARATGRLGGASAGGVLGAKLGAPGGPYGVLVGVFVGGVAGSIGGEELVEQVLTPREAVPLTPEEYYGPGH